MESLAYSIKNKAGNGYDSGKSRTAANQIDINREDYSVNLLDID